MTTVFPNGNTPENRGIALRDGAGGASERPSLTGTRDEVLQTVGAKTTEIRLTATGTDFSIGEFAGYNFGVVDKASIGRYLFKAQSAASPTADPLGAEEFIYLDVRQETAGLFKVDPENSFDALVVAEDETQDETNMATANRESDKDVPLFTTTTADGLLVFSVLTAASAVTVNAANLLGNLQGGAVEAGSLFMSEARAAVTEVWNVTRVQ